MEAKHTPGPWVARESRSRALGETHWAVTADAIDGQAIAHTTTARTEDREACEAMAADARLLAAAPDLLAALVALAAWDTPNHPDHDKMFDAWRVRMAGEGEPLNGKTVREVLVSDAHAAIAKAKGGTK